MTWGLFLSHTRLFKSANMILLLMCLEALWLLYVHFLLYHTVQERSLDIHLVNLPSHLHCQRDDGSDRSVSRYWSKSFFIVNAFLLGIPLGYKSCLEFLYAAICSIFDLLDPS